MAARREDENAFGTETRETASRNAVMSVGAALSAARPDRRDQTFAELFRPVAEHRAIAHPRELTSTFSISAGSRVDAARDDQVASCGRRGTESRPHREADVAACHEPAAIDLLRWSAP